MHAKLPEGCYHGHGHHGPAVRHGDLCPDEVGNAEDHEARELIPVGVKRREGVPLHRKSRIGNKPDDQDGCHYDPDGLWQGDPHDGEDSDQNQGIKKQIRDAVQSGSGFAGGVVVSGDGAVQHVRHAGYRVDHHEKCRKRLHQKKPDGAQDP